MTSTYDPNHPRTIEHARKNLRALLRNPPHPTGLGSSERRWYRLYVRRTCHYLLGLLTDEELLDYETPFTVLHELVSYPLALRPRDPDALRESEAWAALSARDHLTLARAFTMLPPSFDALAHVPLIRGFLEYLCSEGAMTKETWLRLDHEYAAFDRTEPARASA